MPSGAGVVTFEVRHNSVSGRGSRALIGLCGGRRRTRVVLIRGAPMTPEEMSLALSDVLNF